MTAVDRQRILKITSGLAALAGIGGMVSLIAYQGLQDVAQVLVPAGWGILLITLFHLVPLTASALSWKSAHAAIADGTAAVFIWARIVREAVNGLLPVAQVGGDIVGARILTFHGSKATAAGASVLVDLTLEFLTQIVFTMIGLGLLLWQGGGRLASWSAIGLAIAIVLGTAFVMAQRRGLFRLLEILFDRMAGMLNWPALGSLDNLHDVVMTIYRDRRAMVAATLWHLASWLVGAVEVWLTLRILGADVGFADALVIESLGQAIRTAAFMVPGAFGIQEGGYLLLGVHFGVPPEIALSVSLVKRVRELAIGIPAMLIWQVIEGRRLLARTPVRTDHPS